MTTRINPWVPSSEQKAYYLAQFLRMQPDPRAKLDGLHAKAFFELSKLPNTELSDIWELSDADCDGELTLGEFCVAMHLVVLRRNGFPVPRILPCALVEVVNNQNLFTISSRSASVTLVDGDSTETKHTIDPTIESSFDQSHPMSGLANGQPRSGSPASLSRTTPTLMRPRRWSISSQSDVSSFAEGILHFETKPNWDVQLLRPIPLRARTLPVNGHQLDSTASCHDVPEYPPSPLLTTPLPPPPPPPRAHLVSGKAPQSAEVIPMSEEVTTCNQSFPNPISNEVRTDLEKLTGTFPRCDVSPADHDESPQSTITQLSKQCDELIQSNEQLAVQLMQLQQHRIGLQILLERLLPLNAGSSIDRDST